MGRVVGQDLFSELDPGVCLEDTFPFSHAEADAARVQPFATEEVIERQRPNEALRAQEPEACGPVKGEGDLPRPRNLGGAGGGGGDQGLGACPNHELTPGAPPSGKGPPDDRSLRPGELLPVTESEPHGPPQRDREKRERGGKGNLHDGSGSAPGRRALLEEPGL